MLARGLDVLLEGDRRHVRVGRRTDDREAVLAQWIPVEDPGAIDLDRVERLAGRDPSGAMRLAPEPVQRCSRDVDDLDALFPLGCLLDDPTMHLRERPRLRRGRRTVEDRDEVDVAHAVDERARDDRTEHVEPDEIAAQQRLQPRRQAPEASIDVVRKIWRQPHATPTSARRRSAAASSVSSRLQNANRTRCDPSFGSEKNDEPGTTATPSRSTRWCAVSTSSPSPRCEMSAIT